MLTSLFITFLVVIASLVQTSAAIPIPKGASSLQRRGSFQGDGTYYDPGLGACEVVSSENEYIAALNHVQFGVFARSKNSPACFSCAMVHGPSGSVKVKIVDMCPGCKYGDIDLSPLAFDQIASKAQGRVPISWEFTPCEGKGGNKNPPPPPPTKSSTPPKKSNPVVTTSTLAPTPKPSKVISSPYKKAPQPSDPSPGDQSNPTECTFQSKCVSPGQHGAFEVCVHGTKFTQSCAPGTVCKDGTEGIFCDWA
ncbi:hypothetical protein K7432_013561 [Basidiobolus ranarum]|uniref:Expansin-like EG45 domain-containing protein n=1 Tax=Basidiobolus ranarum TaxID=34480 RepID=A0ABR2WJ08_9FUNG